MEVRSHVSPEQREREGLLQQTGGMRFAHGEHTASKSDETHSLTQPLAFTRALTAAFVALKGPRVRGA